MIPSHWFRRIVLALFILEVAGLVMWLTSVLVPDPADQPFAQTVAAIAVLLGYYTATPWYARFLAPAPSPDDAMQARLRHLLEAMPPGQPVFLYENVQENANTVGILPAHARIYITSGLVSKLTDDALKGVLAHENTHVREHHILVLFVAACTYALLMHFLNDQRLVVVGLLAFLALRRNLEYRADAGAAAQVGVASALAFLQELTVMYPSKAWARYLMLLMPYPPLPMRIRALQTGRRPIV